MCWPKLAFYNTNAGSHLKTTGFNMVGLLLPLLLLGLLLGFLLDFLLGVLPALLLGVLLAVLPEELLGLQRHQGVAGDQETDRTSTAS